MSRSLTNFRSLTRFRNIGEGQGGTFVWNPYSAYYHPNNIHDTETLPFIGTHGCHTTVGVYFEVDDHRFFVAHINAWVDLGNFLCDRKCNVEEGMVIKNRIFTMLHDQRRRGDWKGSLDRAQRSLIIVCPGLNIDPVDRWMIAASNDTQHQTGW